MRSLKLLPLAPLASLVIGCGDDGGGGQQAAPFTDVGAGLVGVTDCSLAWGDYDADGDLDLALAGSPEPGAASTSVYRNDDGIFVTVAG